LIMDNTMRAISRYLAITLLINGSLFAKAAPQIASTDTATPALMAPNGDATKSLKIFFGRQKLPNEGITLKGLQPFEYEEFTTRSDQIITKAVVHLHFTPSPSLIPLESQLKIYLNGELMGVVPVTAEQLGKPNQVEILLTPCISKILTRLS
ncbi:MAG: cellulose biosynthesis cyclic di-GMP-binding regulatory protein BcsB, partial [Legionellales bacterium]